MCCCHNSIEQDDVEGDSDDDDDDVIKTCKRNPTSQETALHNWSSYNGIGYLLNE